MSSPIRPGAGADPPPYTPGSGGASVNNPPVLKGKAAIIGIEKAIYRVKHNSPTKGTTGIAKPATTEDPSKEDPPRVSDTAKHPNVLPSPESSTKSRSMLDIDISASASASAALRLQPLLDQGPRLVHHRSHIYDIRPAWLGDIGKHILVDCTVGGSLLDKMKRKGYDPDGYVWKRGTGKVLAVERKEEIGEDDVVAGTYGNLTKPRLEVELGFGEKGVDFLVAAWVARVAFEAMKAAKEPMTWDQSTLSKLHP
ncbi:hypothetical protein P154DRAFT_529161 [Amniculicola lignicola CBS 123094]|uniref:Uncharacterized protein n=1 Tax=Amniculicola lignicola CBS 123094 TaxID=1392246 RepID=A0A6A5X3Q9_9PLEO|nr:hypothetical protein P154DRAFT_529161 [Amniculicola lignicola CBS 123094]